MYSTYNSNTRKYEEIDVEVDELVEGMRIVRRFWSNDCGFVTIPGASLYIVNKHGEMVLEVE